MKHLIFLAVLFSLLALTACSEGDTILGSPFQGHDANEMMGLMHDMMDEMEAMPVTNDPDEDFALMMHHHHMGATNMANKELEKGDDATLRQMATEMIAKQQAEMAELMAFVESHTVHLNKPEYTQEIMGIMEHLNGDKDIQPLTGNTDHDFAVLMIPHHESAIEMAEALLKYGEDAETRQIAQQIIEDQKTEVLKLQQWLINNKPY
jgi:uncharacterized protein (DUF305 family)